jgi:hypothetical protein
MKVKESRRHARVKTVNLLSYVCIDESSNPLDQGMGKTLDISKGGLLMETGVPVEAKFVLLMSMNLREELIQIKGKVIYCRQEDRGVFHTGIRFIETNEKINEVVADMIRVFVQTKKGGRE